MSEPFTNGPLILSVETTSQFTEQTNGTEIFLAIFSLPVVV